MESPKSCIIKNAPTKDTGTAIIGINVERQSPKNKNTTTATNIKASRRVCNTCSMEASKKLETS